MQGELRRQPGGGDQRRLANRRCHMSAIVLVAARALRIVRAEPITKIANNLRRKRRRYLLTNRITSLFSVLVESRRKRSFEAAAKPPCSCVWPLRVTPSPCSVEIDKHRFTLLGSPPLRSHARIRPVSFFLLHRLDGFSLRLPNPCYL